MDLHITPNGIKKKDEREYDKYSVMILKYLIIYFNDNDGNQDDGAK